MAETKVTRISAKSDRPKKTSGSASASAKKRPTKAPRSERQPKSPFMKALYALGGYFKGAWEELRQVRWPSRRATWGLTLAVLIFSLVLGAIIVLLDLLFKYLFELIIS